MSLLGRRVTPIAAIFLILFACAPLYGVDARFDLSGPKVEVRITRGSKTLPIDSVPNLHVGDKIWLHPNLPADQSAHYLLIAAFLRGTTNPPPDSWFTRIETWNKKVRAEGVYIVVPAEAQQVILFLAPETGGDFSTLKAAVKGRPGIFVRASQDLAEAGFEQGRIERYLSAMRQVPPTDPKALAEHSELLARTLNLKPNPNCFKQPVDMQYTCLTQTGNQSLLDDSHAQTIVTSLANGPGSDLINQASYTQAFGAGVYSAYVGAVVDLVRLTSNLHTAQYQYIPAIAFPEDADLKLRLNTAPSFRNPKSVIVIGLPAIQNAAPPPLRPNDPKFVTCLLKPKVVLPVEGAPLVFSTSFAHDMVLHIEGSDSKTDIPLVADPFQGGLVRSSIPLRQPIGTNQNETKPATLTPAADSPPPTPVPVIPPGSNQILGTITGYWGFEHFVGPTLLLQNTAGMDWKITTTDNLIVGRENHLNLTSTGTACIDTITVDGASGKSAQTTFKSTAKPNHVEVALTLKSADPGSLKLDVKQFGDSKVESVNAKSFSEPARLAAFVLHAGDTTATLTGNGLSQVKQLTIDHWTFLPTTNTITDSTNSSAGSDSLQLDLPSGIAAPTVKVGDKLTATVELKDGRTLSLPTIIQKSRPAVTLLNKSIPAPAGSFIQLANADDLPVNQQITFSLKSVQDFPRAGKIEIANADESLHATLSVSTGTLVLQDPHTLFATFDPLKSFGMSAFGPLRLRPVSAQGIAGDWLPLATLVRVPTLKELHCVADTTKSCNLIGSSLYLLDSIATDAAFTAPTPIPQGFVGTTIAMPHPTGSTFYIRLRDDPFGANPATLPVIVDKTPKHAAAEPNPDTPAPAIPSEPTPSTPAQSTQPVANPATPSAAPIPPPTPQAP